jgi:CRP-like cAMP-binding protein
VALDVAAMVAGAAIAPVLLANLGLDGTLSLLGIGIPVLVAATMPWWIRTDREAVARLAELAPRVRTLEAMGILTQASPAVLERLAAGATEVDLPAGTVVIHEGDPADALYVLAAGEVAVTSGQGGSTRELATLAAPGFFGEIGLLQRIPRTATVTALSDVALLRVDGASFLDSLTTTPASPAFVESARLRLAGTIPTATDETTGTDTPGGSRPTADPVA